MMNRKIIYKKANSLRIILLLFVMLGVVASTAFAVLYYPKVKKDHVYAANSIAQAYYRVLSNLSDNEKYEDLFTGNRVIFGEVCDGELLFFKNYGSNDQVTVTIELNEPLNESKWGAILENGLIKLLCISSDNLFESDVRSYEFEEQLKMSSFFKICKIGYYKP